MIKVSIQKLQVKQRVSYRNVKITMKWLGTWWPRCILPIALVVAVCGLHLKLRLGPWMECTTECVLSLLYGHTLGSRQTFGIRPSSLLTYLYCVPTGWSKKVNTVKLKVFFVVVFFKAGLCVYVQNKGGWHLISSGTNYKVNWSKTVRYLNFVCLFIFTFKWSTDSVVDPHTLL